MKNVIYDVMNVLADSTIKQDKLFLPDIQLDRNLYVAVNKCLMAIGGKWNRSAKAHIFKTDVESIIEEIILTGEYTDQKKEYQFFETPLHIVKDLIELADIQPNESVLEPSAGRGRIACMIDNCHCVELNPDNRKFLKDHGYIVIGDDFMNINTKYDVIVANPPFSKQQDIDHINHMIEIANRRVVSIASSSVLFRDNKKTVDFRNKISYLGGTITPLPDKSFIESGTNVNTCIVCVDGLKKYEM